MLIFDSYVIIFQPQMQSKVLMQSTSLIPPGYFPLSFNKRFWECLHFLPLRCDIVKNQYIPSSCLYGKKHLEVFTQKFDVNFAMSIKTCKETFFFITFLAIFLIVSCIAIVCL